MKRKCEQVNNQKINVFHHTDINKHLALSVEERPNFCLLCVHKSSVKLRIYVAFISTKTCLTICFSC